MDSIVALALLILAAWRTSRMVVAEEGPFAVFERLRTALHSRPENWVQRGFDCSLCVSVYLSFLLTPLYPWGGPTDYLLASLGVAGGAAVLHRIVP